MRLVLCFLFSALAWAQPTRTVELTWEDLANPAGTTYRIYRGEGRCTQSPPMVMIAQDIAVKTFVQNGVAIGNYCYHVTANLNGIESLPSNTALAEVRPWPPTKFDVGVK